MNTISAAAASVIGARHLRTARNGQDAAATWVGEGTGAVVVCDGCGAGGSSEVGARLGAQLVIAAVAARLRRGERPSTLWSGVRDQVVATLGQLVDTMSGDRAAVIHEHFLFTIVAAAVAGDEACVWAVGDGGYAFRSPGDRFHGEDLQAHAPRTGFADPGTLETACACGVACASGGSACASGGSARASGGSACASGGSARASDGSACASDGAMCVSEGPAALAVDDAWPVSPRLHVLGPFAGNEPPYLAYDLLGAPAVAHVEAWHARAGQILVATDGAVELELGDLLDARTLAHPDGLRRRLALHARGDERIDWAARRVVRTPAALQDDGAVAVLGWVP